MSRLRACSGCGGIFRADFARCPLDGAEVRLVEEDPNLGRAIDDRYVIEALIGSGAMGRVYRVRHARMGKSLALKLMYGDLASNGLMRARFEREAQAASRLDHPNVVTTTDFGEMKGSIPYLTMELLEGRTVRDWVADEGPLPEPVIRQLAEQICDGLIHAHERGVVHRDLKPENLFVVERAGLRTVKIVDFGIAYSLRTAAGEARLTDSGLVVGTPSYMAPEQALGEEVDGRADLFSLGLTLFFMFTGRAPFSGEAPRVLHRLATESIPAVVEINPQARISAEMQALLTDLSRREPELRVGSAEQLQSRLRGLGTRPRVMAEQDEASPVRSPSRVPLFAGAAVALLVAIGALAWARSGVVRIDALPVEPSKVEGAPQEVPHEKVQARAAPEVVLEPRAEVEPTPEVEEFVERSASARERSASPARQRRTRNASRARSEPEAELRARPRAAPPPGPDALRAAYRRVGEQLEALAARQGEAETAGLRERYFEVPYAAALRSTEARVQALSALEHIGAEIAARQRR